MSGPNVAAVTVPQPEEQLKNSRLEAFLCAQAGAQRVTIEHQQRLSGGAIQENWLLDVRVEDGPHAGHQRWVLRSDAQSAVQGSLSRAQEFAVLGTVHRAGVKVPRPLWLCEDASVHGRAFFIMEWVCGITAGHRLTSQLGAEGDPQLVADLGANLARIHRILPAQARLDFLGDPQQASVQASIDAHRTVIDRLGVAQPVLEWGLRWCESNAPESATRCLLHGDFRTGNYLAEFSQLQAVLDWEFTGWGDPREDIGWFTARCWRFARPDLEAGGVGTFEHFMGGYTEVSPLSIERDELVFWQVMATLRWAVIALQQAQRHLSGEEPSLELALTGRLIPELELDILRLTGGLRR
ncbi:phosphotransferase family protein [Pseudomonas sp. R5(2019)]|uniref:phosphotransferase family protein n=1 Tax=Pseudomonas sp. R5(2019) TaxID=2697566 RepID=UPI001411E18A|nr:phosphotransferase family protein [Pseudomonas sp. R5(2019)]NBA96890.1 phosphotransferase [Pseudomonas sp. R5(2019)]